ncbi:MAG: nitrogenase-stabilizing/protective protein NifW [Leptolyngbyaceae cyanobacterium bins.349]|nr:nitrogenase-stabilizing/protective protein NifW [Leptolyngbyaceae cyanobacterium bins.349]
MSGTLAEFKQLVNAEEYFEFFHLPYDAHFVNVNRLHILRKFSGFMSAIDAAAPDLSDTEKLDRYKGALEEAYSTFMSSSPGQEKLFKVFNDPVPGIVTLSQIGIE